MHALLHIEIAQNVNSEDILCDWCTNENINKCDCNYLKNGKANMIRTQFDKYLRWTDEARFLTSELVSPRGKRVP